MINHRYAWNSCTIWTSSEGWLFRWNVKKMNQISRQKNQCVDIKNVQISTLETLITERMPEKIKKKDQFNYKIHLRKYIRFYFIKFERFEKQTKFGKNLPHGLDVQTMRKIFCASQKVRTLPISKKIYSFLNLSRRSTVQIRSEYILCPPHKLLLAHPDLKNLCNEYLFCIHQIDELTSWRQFPRNFLSCIFWFFSDFFVTSRTGALALLPEQTWTQIRKPRKVM